MKKREEEKLTHLANEYGSFFADQERVRGHLVSVVWLAEPEVSTDKVLSKTICYWLSLGKVLSFHS